MKMTIEEFFESKEMLAIHTPIEEQAIKLTRAFHEVGHKWWQNGESYLDENGWKVYKEDTIYCNRRFVSTINSSRFHPTILKFEEIDFEEKEEK